MEYRTLGRTGLRVSAIGLGTEHLRLNQESMERVFAAAVEAGVNYVDVPFCDPDNTRWFWRPFAPAVRPYRDKLTLALHWLPDGYQDLEQARRCFEQCLSRLGTDFADVAIIGIIDTEEQWESWGRRSAEALRRYQEQGQVGHIGISGHYIAAALRAVQSGLVEVLMYRLNLLLHDDPEVKCLLQACASRNVGLVAMKPFHGGRLFEVAGKPTGITPSQCLSYVLSQPVATTVPGVRHVTDLKSVLRYFRASEQERDYRPALAALPARFEGVCTFCSHCLPCPEGIPIVDVLGLLDMIQEGFNEHHVRWYQTFPTKPTACTSCGACMDRCPFHVDVIGGMRRVGEVFGGR